MLWLGAFMALAACGGGESLTFDESMDLLSSAMAGTVAGEFSIDDTGIDVVEMDNSTGEYTFNIFSMYFDPERGWFGYSEDRNPFAPPARRRFLTTGGADYEFIEEGQCYSDNPTFIVQGGPIRSDLMLPNMMPDEYVGGKRVVQDGSTTETIEFETGQEVQTPSHSKMDFWLSGYFTYSTTDLAGVLGTVSMGRLSPKSTFDATMTSV